MQDVDRQMRRQRNVGSQPLWIDHARKTREQSAGSHAAQGEISGVGGKPPPLAVEETVEPTE
jgi:hypothetical protein